MLTDADRVPLGDRCWIGDTATGATVAADGTIDWYCPGRFDAPAALGRILDPGAGAVRVGPVRRSSDARRRRPDATQTYLDGTLVARTVTRGPGFATELVDLLPWPGGSELAPGRIVRVLRSLAGPVDVEVEVVAGASYGPAAERRLARWSRGMVTGPLMVRAGSPFEAVPLDRDHRALWRATRRLGAGEAMVVTIDDPVDDHHLPLSPDAAGRVVDATAAAWRSWVARLSYHGPYRAQVERSALLVKALTAPGGAPVDGGTAGLPRRAGGERNVDARGVSLRVAAAAARILARIGLGEDAEAAEGWLRRAVEGSTLPWPSRLDGDAAPLPEPVDLPVAGWRRSQPVPVGWAPPGVDHDVVGDVVAAVSASTRAVDGTEGGPGPLTGAWPALVGAADRLAERWADPDVGVWGLGGPSRRVVASRLQAWSALDGMARRAWAANPLDLDAVPWHRAAADIVRWCEKEALAADGGLVLAAGPDADADAALLRVAWTGPWPARHPVVVRTVDRILEQLSVGDLLHRYPTSVDDGVAGGDDPDVEASLWAVRALARLGRWEEAHQRMEAVCALGGTTGLLTATADPGTGEVLGNLPAAGAHLALIEAALELEAGPV